VDGRIGTEALGREEATRGGGEVPQTGEEVRRSVLTLRCWEREGRPGKGEASWTKRCRYVQVRIGMGARYSYSYLVARQSKEGRKVLYREEGGREGGYIKREINEGGDDITSDGMRAHR
jgi:hypothetical protein